MNFLEPIRILDIEKGSVCLNPSLQLAKHCCCDHTPAPYLGHQFKRMEMSGTREVVKRRGVEDECHPARGDKSCLSSSILIGGKDGSSSGLKVPLSSSRARSSVIR